jgi:hypothetical protein
MVDTHMHVSRTGQYRKGGCFGTDGISAIECSKCRETCPKGSYLHPPYCRGTEKGDISCLSCRRGTYTNSTTATACLTCAPGRYSCRNSSSCTACGVHEYWSKEACRCMPCRRWECKQDQYRSVCYGEDRGVCGQKPSWREHSIFLPTDFSRQDSASRENQEQRLPPLYRHAAAVINSSVYVFGGRTDTGRSNVLYVLDMESAGLPVFSRASVAGSLPPAREMHAMAAGKTVLYVSGGSGRGVILSDTWMLDARAQPPAWVQGPSLATGPIHGHAMAAVRDAQLWCFGGRDSGSGLSSELMFLNMTSKSPVWEIKAVSSHAVPPARWKHAMVSVSNSDQLYVFGGEGPDGAAYRDLWLLRTELRPLTWTLMSVGGEISARKSFGMAAIGPKIYVSFGLDTRDQTNQDLWEVDVGVADASWIRVATNDTDQAPTHRHSHAMVAFRGTLVSIGGEHAVEGLLDHVWQMDVCSPVACANGKVMVCDLNATNRGSCSGCFQQSSCCREAQYEVSGGSGGVCAGISSVISIRSCAKSDDDIIDKLAEKKQLLDDVLGDVSCRETVDSMCKSVGAAAAKDKPLLCSRVMPAVVHFQPAHFVQVWHA